MFRTPIICWEPTHLWVSPSPVELISEGDIWHRNVRVEVPLSCQWQPDNVALDMVSRLCTAIFTGLAKAIPLCYSTKARKVLLNKVTANPKPGWNLATSVKHQSKRVQDDNLLSLICVPSTITSMDAGVFHQQCTPPSLIRNVSQNSNYYHVISGVSWAPARSFLLRGKI
jgi:hypothetical protein